MFSQRRGGMLVLALYLMIALSIFATALLLMFQDKLYMVRRLNNRDYSLTSLVKAKEIMRSVADEWREEQVNSQAFSHFSASLLSEPRKEVTFKFKEGGGRYYSHEEAESALNAMISEAMNDRLRPDLHFPSKELTMGGHLFRTVAQANFNDKTLKLEISVDLDWDFDADGFKVNVSNQVLSQISSALRAIAKPITKGERCGADMCFATDSTTARVIDRRDMTPKELKGKMYKVAVLLKLGDVHLWVSTPKGYDHHSISIYLVGENTAVHSLNISVEARHDANLLKERDISDHYETEEVPVDTDGDGIVDSYEEQQVYKYTDVHYRVDGKGCIEVKGISAIVKESNFYVKDIFFLENLRDN